MCLFGGAHGCGEVRGGGGGGARGGGEGGGGGGGRGGGGLKTAFIKSR